MTSWCSSGKSCVIEICAGKVAVACLTEPPQSGVNCMLVCRVAVVLIACFAVSLEAEEVASSDAVAESSSYVDNHREMRASFISIANCSQQVRSLLRKHASSDSVSDRIAMTLDMVSMVEQLSADPRFSRSRQMKQLRTALFTRLRSIRKDLEADIRRKKKQKTASATKRTPTKIEIDPTVLAQLNQAANGNANQPGNVNQAGNAGGPPDHAAMLIEVIQRTISPQSWDVNGGASSIQYWRPGMALVIRAPDGLHRELNPLLQQLRKQ